MCLATSYRGSSRMQDCMFKAPAFTLDRGVFFFKGGLQYLDTLKARFQLWHWETSGRCLFFWNMLRSQNQEGLLDPHCRKVMRIKSYLSRGAKLYWHHRMFKSQHQMKRNFIPPLQDLIVCGPGQNMSILLPMPLSLNIHNMWLASQGEMMRCHTLYYYTFRRRTGKPIGMADTVLACTSFKPRWAHSQQKINSNHTTRSFHDVVWCIYRSVSLPSFVSCWIEQWLGVVPHLKPFKAWKSIATLPTPRAVPYTHN